MQANKLRIGNLILDVQDKKPCNVTIEILQEIYGGMDFYEPIQLNEEWLLKFGFVTKKTMSDTFVAPYPDNYYHIIKHHGIYVFRCAGCSLQRVNYVHQLQNLYFALTGEELTIKE